MRFLAIVVTVCGLALASARLLEHSVGDLSASAELKYCDVPVKKAEVVLPERVAGRSEYSNTHTMTSGYINVTNEDWLFYWFFESKASAGKSAPLMLWSNGGPGCSAMEAATTENGPVVLDMIKQSHALSVGQLSDNPYSWVDQANIIYVDQPRYVGFSFGYGKYVESSEEAGKDIVTFLLGWMDLFPSFRERELILASESYGGHYVPAWANAVNDYNDRQTSHKFNLKGLLIGNGIVNETVQTDELYYKFLKSHDLVPADAKPTSRDNADALMVKHIGYEPNYYDYRIKSYNYTNWAAWFTRSDVTSSLHVCGDAGKPAFVGGGAGCINFPNGFDENDRFDYSGALARSLDRGIAVTFYYGKADRACNYMGGYAMALALEWSGQDAFKDAKLEPLMIGSVEGGQFQKSDLLTFVQVEAAGHMVPMDQPAAASWVVNDLVTNIKNRV